MALWKCAVRLALVATLGACADPGPDSTIGAVTDEEPVRSWLDGEQAVSAAHSGGGNLPSVSEMIGGLEDKLSRNPNDLKGWRLLAQSYAFTGDMQRAREAADQAVSLGADPDELDVTIRRAHTAQVR